MNVLIDSCILGELSHPNMNLPASEILIEQRSMGAVNFYIPEIADYELRRELIRADKLLGLTRLDQIEKLIDYMPISTKIMRKAAELWALSRQMHRPGASDAALDADVIIAAPALELNASVWTNNEKHLTIFVPIFRPNKMI